ncbi:phage holin family protein [Nocardioides speluncae]|uniref:phage holin family protein n=1 Tax=Nocardioides speluncae TaxID=2670337 RepID=UPI000D687E01|nr:phage holin family protein [Nocardioides speluncae]
MRFVTWLLTNAAGIAVAAWLLGGISFDGDRWQDKIIPLLLVALIFGLVTVFVEPVVKVLSLPFIIVTIGLFLFVINALMFLLTGWIADQADIGFAVDGFWIALLGSVIVTIVTGFIDVAVLEDD